ncbi:MAG: adenosyl-hopene transferase HpnH [Phycisphaerales bacterium]|jgi:hopanoid biosynthesis associated radical SAM protein HpnH|nr:adenosyl-hopene transferase HpnH [Phycisphaerales bacterium]
MGVPISQMWTVTSYVLGQRLRGRRKYPLVLMLEPLFRCNLACAGCGKIQYPAHILRKDMPLEEALRAVDECGAPMVSLAGGEPLLYGPIRELVQELLNRKKYIYLCTNAILLKEKLEAGWFESTKYLTLSVHMDGPRDDHDFSVCREGTHDKAMAGIRTAVEMGYRVTTNTTLFEGADPNAIRDFFDEMMDAGVEGMMLSPGYAYEAAADQANFLGRKKTSALFNMLLSNRRKRWKFNQSMLFLEFLMGKREYDCTPWGNPTYSLFGWQKPCYLVNEGYVDTFDELMTDTEWPKYGFKSGNPKCANCMVHSGYEATAVDHTFTSIRGLFGTIKAMAFGRYPSDSALQTLEDEKSKPHGPEAHLVQLGLDVDALKEAKKAAKSQETADVT